MLNQVEIRNPNGSYIRLPIGDFSSGYNVEEITGLDPVKATLVSSTFAEMDGAQYNAGRREPRNIAITLGLYPDYATTSVESLRNRLYTYAMPKAPVTLTFFNTDGTYKMISGIVESLESALFVKDPKLSISIMCFDPDFTDNIQNKWTGNIDYRDGGPTIDYLGTVPTGMVVTVKAGTDSNSQLNSFSWSNTGQDGVKQQMDYQNPVLAGEFLTINTTRGQKSASSILSGQTKSTLYGVSSTSSWPYLLPGRNNVNFQFNQITPAEVTVSWTNRYGGL